MAEVAEAEAAAAMEGAAVEAGAATEAAAKGAPIRRKRALIDARLHHLLIYGDGRGDAGIDR